MNRTVTSHLVLLPINYILVEPLETRSGQMAVREDEAAARPLGINASHRFIAL
jgi:hypothetical protein